MMKETDKSRRGWYNECKRLMDQNAIIAGELRDERKKTSDLERRVENLSGSLENVMENNDLWKDECVALRGAVVNIAKLIKETI